MVRTDVVRRSAVAAVLVLVLAVSLPASADVPPPPGYVETCTVERQQKPGEECRECRAWHGERDACEKTLGKDGFERRCSTAGASVWTELWCRNADAPAAPPKPAEPPAPPAPPAPDGGATTPPPEPVETGTGPDRGTPDRMPAF